MGHNVGDAAARSVEKSKKVEAKAARTPEQRIKDIRMNAEGILSVPNAEVVFLLEQYDRLDRTIAIQSGEMKAREETIASLVGAVAAMEIKLKMYAGLEEASKPERALAKNPVLGAPYNLKEPSDAE